MASTTSKVAAGGAVAAVAAGVVALLAPSPKCTDGNVVCLSWQASTGWDDGSKFAADAAPSYNVYRAPKENGNAPTRVKVSQTGQLNVQLNNEPRGEQCYSVSTTAKPASSTTRVEGVATNTVCKIVRLAAPTEGAIEAPTDGAIEPRK